MQLVSNTKRNLVQPTQDCNQGNLSVVKTTNLFFQCIKVKIIKIKTSWDPLNSLGAMGSIPPLGGPGQRKTCPSYNCVVCPLHGYIHRVARAFLHLSCPLVIPRALSRKDLSVLHVVCPLVTPRRVPGENLCVLHVICITSTNFRCHPSCD